MTRTPDHDAPTELSEADLDASGGAAAGSHRRQMPVSFSMRLGKTGNAGAGSLADPAQVVFEPNDEP